MKQNSGVNDNTKKSLDAHEYLAIYGLKFLQFVKANHNIIFEHIILCQM